MVKYFTSTDLEHLNELNTRGLPRGPKDGTGGWVSIIKHPSRDEWAACIADKDLPVVAAKVGASDAAMIADNLKTQEQMQADGWFPVEPMEGVS